MLAALWLLQEHAAAAEEGFASPFEVNFGLFFWTWVVFAILLVTANTMGQSIRERIPELEMLALGKTQEVSRSVTRQITSFSSAKKKFEEQRTRRRGGIGGFGGFGGSLRTL